VGIMEGISKDTLINIDPWAYDNQQDLLNAILLQCKELNPWMPIDENTPKDRRLLFLFESGNISSGYWDATYCAWETIMDVHIESLSGKITHYQELPPDPKT